MLFNAVCVAVLIGLSLSAVLSTFPSPTSDAANVTAPVFPATLVTGYGGGLLAEYCFTLSTFPRPTSDLLSITAPLLPFTEVTVAPESSAFTVYTPSADLSTDILVPPVTSPAAILGKANEPLEILEALLVSVLGTLPSPTSVLFIIGEPTLPLTLMTG